MLNIEEIRARARRAINEEFPDGPVEGSAAYYCVTGDVPALCDEVEQDEKLIESYKKSNLEQAEENYRLEKDNAVLKRALEMAVPSEDDQKCYIQQAKEELGK